MKTQIVKFGMKVLPVVKKVGPMVVAGITAVAEVAKEQKANAEKLDMLKRIEDLEKIVKKQG